MSKTAVRREQQPVILVVFLHPGSLWSATPTGKESRSDATAPPPAGDVASSSGPQPASRGAGRQPLCQIISLATSHHENKFGYLLLFELRLLSD